MKDFKVQLDDSLWERFYRAFPEHGERTAIIRKVIRRLVVLKSQEVPLHRIVADQVYEDTREE